jgi:glycosyltransferase involved in cell wall biosynthesis
MAITGIATVRLSDVALPRSVSIAVLIPCYNEAIAVGRVVSEFRAALPDATIYAYDNNSTDDTIAVARHAGAIVRRESRQGKGNVVRRMFADIEADVYILVDGDDTYDAAAAPKLVSTLIDDDLDFVNGARFNRSSQAYRFGHRFGNVMLTQIVRLIFGRNFSDMLSGYKILSRRFVKSFPATSSGFETETEIVVHALELRMPCAELVTAYGERPEGSSSKLRTVQDGIKILFFIARLIKNERPFQLFALVGALLILAAFILGFPILLNFLETGLVPRFPTVILCAGLVIVGVICFFSALILDMTTRTRQELKRLAYLSFPKTGHRPS